MAYNLKINDFCQSYFKKTRVQFSHFSHVLFSATPWTARRSRRSVLGVHWKDWCWSWNSNTLATWYEELTHLKRPWIWERLKAGGEGHDRGWDGWMASLSQWIWVWVNTRSWWWTRTPGMLQSWGCQELDMTEWLNWTLVFLKYDWQKSFIFRLYAMNF